MISNGPTDPPVVMSTFRVTAVPKQTGVLLPRLMVLLDGQVQFFMRPSCCRPAHPFSLVIVTTVVSPSGMSELTQIPDPVLVSVHVTAELDPVMFMFVAFVRVPAVIVALI